MLYENLQLQITQTKEPQQHVMSQWLLFNAKWAIC